MQGTHKNQLVSTLILSAVLDCSQMGCLLHPATQLWDKAALNWKRKGPLKRCLRDLVGWEPGNRLGCGWRDQCEIAEL